MELTPVQARIVGCLVEKELTTPQQYPLTLNALVAACNQTSNRHPVTAYDTATVESAVLNLKAQGLIRFVHPSHGRSVTRYRHVLDEALRLEAGPLALVAVLVLRGPQTVGELRGRTERMAPFAEVSDVGRALEELADREPALVVRLPRQAGHKDVRYAHLLAGEPEVPDVAPEEASTSPRAAGRSEELTALRAEVADLRRDLDDLRAALGL